MFASRGSGYEMSSHLLRVTMLYANAMWQGVYSRADQEFGPYSAVEFVPMEKLVKALPG